ncbi:LAFA_0G02234g1_1 [Lachancea sp. 'fantastica']|nr:LAFA_0G02234g1_1 [Lachancea sp. 'fantastica']
MKPDREEEFDGPEKSPKNEHHFVDQSKILKARIALLSTAIGGPDHSSDIDPPPYKIGDDCLACLKDLKRWFKLVDERQSRWDVAAAAAQYNILTDDLIPIMTGWENSYATAAKKARKNGGKVEDFVRNKEYYDKISLNALQLMVLMTWPLILTDQSTQNQVEHYSSLKKSQVIYKKAILSAENGKVLKAAVRLAVEVIKIEKRLRSAKDNVVLRLVLNFLRNVAAIEPSDLTLSNKKKTATKGINATDMLPPNISKNDISLAAVIEAFNRNKVLGLLLTFSSSINQEFDAAFINVPLLELMFFLVKNVNHSVLYRKRSTDKSSSRNLASEEHRNGSSELSGLLQKEHEMKKNVIRNTSTRHSNFGTMLSIQTSDKRRLTVSGGQNLLNSDYALRKLDSRKKWNKRILTANETVEGLPSNLLSSDEETVYWDDSISSTFRKFVDDFVKSGFNSVLSSVTDYFTTEDDKMVLIHQIEYLLFYSWFLKYSRLAKQNNVETDISPISFALRDTALILVGQLLRRGMEHKIWAVVHAGMIAYTELISLLESMGNNESELEAKGHVEYQLFQEERLKLFSSIPRTASNHSLSYVRGCVNLIHVLFKIIERTNKRQEAQSQSAPEAGPNTIFEQAKILAEEEGVEIEEAVEILEFNTQRSEVNFKKLQRSFANDNTIKTYITYLENFKELADEDIKKCIQFLYRIFVSAEEESLLFRIDFMILMKDMISPTGLPTMSRARKHVTKFADVFTSKLKVRLAKSPSWFVGILFPVIHDRETGHYQKYGEKLDSMMNVERVARPSTFKSTEELEGMSASAALDFKFGILVSTLIDRERQNSVETLLENLQRSCAVMKSWLLNEATRGEVDSTPSGREQFETSSSTIRKDVHRDSDFRALLKLCGYQLSRSENESCFLLTSYQITDIETSIGLIMKHMHNTFETPNGEPSSFYLHRPGLEDKILGPNDESREYTEQVREAEELSEEENEYFKSLTKVSSAKSNGGQVPSKGVAAIKKKSVRKRKNQQGGARRASESRDKENNSSNDVYKQREVTSAEMISDSDESDDEFAQTTFYENEMFMRFLLDKYNGSLPQQKFVQFAAFASERIKNSGKLVNDYTALFDGPVPSPSSLIATEAMGGKTLAPKLAQIMEAQNEKDADDLSLSEDVDIDKPVSTESEDLNSNTNKTTVSENITHEYGDAVISKYKRRKAMRIEDDEDDDE